VLSVAGLLYFPAEFDQHHIDSLITRLLNVDSLCQRNGILFRDSYVQVDVNSDNIVCAEIQKESLIDTQDETHYSIAVNIMRLNSLSQENSILFNDSYFQRLVNVDSDIATEIVVGL
jgi:hypothetical protein